MTVRLFLREATRNARSKCKQEDRTIKDDFEIIRAVLPKAKQVKIYPIADVHFGSVLCNEKAWLDFRDAICKDPDAYTVIVGDVINNNTRSSVGSPFDDVVRPREQKRIMAEMLKPLAESGKIIAAVPGNHEKRSLKDADDDPLYDIMCKLDLEDRYRENAAFVLLAVGERPFARGEKSVRGYGATYNIAITHGSGGGALTGSSINKNERFGYALDNIDVLITGHTHKGSITKPAKLQFNAQGGRMIVKPFVCVQACCWQNYGGYALQKMLTPNSTAANDGGQIIALSGNRERKKINVIW